MNKCKCAETCLLNLLHADVKIVLFSRRIDVLNHYVQIIVTNFSIHLITPLHKPSWSNLIIIEAKYNRKINEKYYVDKQQSFPRKGRKLTLNFSTKSCNAFSFADTTIYVSTMEEYRELKVFSDGIRYGCSKCSKTYCQKKTLGRHLRFDCGKSPSFSCRVCLKPYKHGYLVIKHMRQSHKMFIENLRRRNK